MRLQKHNDLSKLFQQDPEPFQVSTTATSFVYKAKIDKPIEHSSQFDDIVDSLDNAGPNDVVFIKIGDCPGGSISAILPLLQAMENTEACVHVHVDSDIASAATMPVMKADIVTFTKHASFMVHTCSWYTGGHSGNVEASTNHNVKNTKELAHDLYDDFLTKEEFDKIFNGLDLYFTMEEVFERLKAREEKRNKTEESVEEENPKPKAKRTPRKKKEQPTLTDLTEILEKSPLED